MRHGFFSQPTYVLTVHSQASPTSVLLPGVGSTTTTLASGRSSPNGPAVDAAGGWVYWGDQGGGTVTKVPTGGGAITTLASGQMSPQAVVIDATSVYWVGASTIMKLTPR